MSDGSSPEINRNRRRVIKGIGASGLGMYLGVVPGRAESRTTEELGSFEGSIDGWRTNGGNDLGLVPVADHPAFITGEYGLRVDVDGDPRPMIENTEQVQRADFVARPYLTADVVASPPSGRNVDLSVRVRFHYTPNGAEAGNSGGGGRGRGPNGQKSVLVEESEAFTVSPNVPTTIAWDMSEISVEKRVNPKRIEIFWQPEDVSSTVGPRGGGGSADYEGYVVFDNVQLGDIADEISRARHAEKFTELEFEHGLYQETDVETHEEAYESGDLRFADGARVPYEVETVSDSKILVTLDGEQFKFGEGWQ